MSATALRSGGAATRLVSCGEKGGGAGRGGLEVEERKGVDADVQMSSRREEREEARSRIARGDVALQPPLGRGSLTGSWRLIAV